MIYHGDLFAVLPTLPANSIDACVTDGPYGIGFMGRKWDTFSAAAAADRLDHTEDLAEHRNRNLKGRKRKPASSPSAIEYDRSLHGQRGFQAFTERWGRELFRVLKPGAYVASCGAPRSAHRMACGLEDAGFVVRDCFAWLFGQGFPKSLDMQRAIDMALCELPGRHCMRDLPPKSRRQASDHVCPVTPLGARWAGYGTGLKPAFEPIYIARKPLEGTLAENLMKHGAGALNIAACRIAFENDADRASAQAMAAALRASQAPKDGVLETYFHHGEASAARYASDADLGRWPSNVLLDELAAAMLDQQSGELETSAAPTFRTSSKFGGIYGAFSGQACPPGRGANSGGASRFFYVAKPSRGERDLGLEDLPPRSGAQATNRAHRANPDAGLTSPRAGAGRLGGSKNYHPTVKPVTLMQFLVRLIVPKGGTCIDPFLGSGTTGMACVLEGAEFIGVDKEADYARELAPRRIRAINPLASVGSTAAEVMP